jgi:trk system potassium uptake protein TrkA
VYIVIVGGGKVGFYLAKGLLDEGHEVLIIERDQQEPHRTEQIADELGDDVVLRGDGCEASTQDKAGVARADMLIAVTGEDEDNLVACQVAKSRFKVPRTIARINNPKNEAIFKLLGIDTTVSATSIILANIEQELPTHHLVQIMTLRGGALKMVELRIPNQSPAVGKSLREIVLPQNALVSLVVDSTGTVTVPTADTVIQAEDDVLAVTSPETEEALRRVLTGLPDGVSERAW